MRTTRLDAFCFFLLGAAIIGAACSNLAHAQTKPWVMAYFPGWELGNGTTNSNPPLSAVDFSSMNAVAYFGFNPQSDGTVDTSFVSYQAAKALVSAAHLNGTKVLMSIGGWNTQSAFEGATSSSNLGTFVGNIMAIVKEYGLDGVDLDWEPYSGAVPSQDYPQFTNLADSLRTDLDQLGPGKLLTSTSGEGNQNLMAATQQYFNEINLMTYDMSAEYGGWPTWYNSAIYSDGDSLNGAPLPSADDLVKTFEAAGVESSRLGIGCELGGTVWQGASLPDILPLSVTISSQSDVPLYASDGSGIMQKYYNPAYYHWDSGAQVGYLSIPAGLLSLLSPAYFITYDDSNSIGAKFNYIRQNHLGGLIIYELGWGYPPRSPNYPLLENVKADAGKDTVQAKLPAVPTAFSSAPVDSATIKLQWEDSTADELGFMVQRKIAGGSSWSTIAYLPAGILSMTDSNLMDGTDYIYRISASNAAGNSAFSDTSGAITPMSTPSNLEAKQIHGGVVELTWLDNSETELGYYVERKDSSGGTYSLLDSVAANDTTFNDSTVKSGVEYFYRVRGYNALVTSEYSNEANVSVLTGVKSDSSVVPKHFYLAQNYPNPFNPTTAISYQLSAMSHVVLAVYDILGRQVATLVHGRQSPGYYSVTLDGSNLPSGVYFYRLTTSSGFDEVRKMVLEK